MRTPKLIGPGLDWVRRRCRWVLLVLMGLFPGCRRMEPPAMPPRTDDRLLLAEMPAFRGIPDCGPEVANETACRRAGAPVLAEVLAHLADTSGARWVGDGTLNIAIDLPSDTLSEVWIQGGIQLPLSRFAGSTIRALSLRVPSLDSAVISFSGASHGCRPEV